MIHTTRGKGASLAALLLFAAFAVARAGWPQEKTATSGLGGAATRVPMSDFFQ